MNRTKWYDHTTVCVPCTMAGFLNDEANQEAWYGVAACEQIRQRAREAHAECEDPRQCTCKHIIGLVLSSDEVTELLQDQPTHTPWQDNPRNGGT